MSKVAIVTDSNSGITQKRGEELGIYVLPMPFFIDGELYLEDITLSQEQFYEKLGADSEISTSQPSPGDVMDLWDKLLVDYDEIVCIPMSSGLSSTCETALSLAQDYDEKVQVVNNQRISVTQEQSVYDAIKLRDEGKSAAEIRQVLEKEKMQASIYVTVDTLKYLKKGGRITPAAAAIGTVLNLKPVLQIQGEKLDAFAKVRGWKAAKKTMLNAIEKDLTDRFADVKDHICNLLICIMPGGFQSLPADIFRSINIPHLIAQLSSCICQKCRFYDIQRLSLLSLLNNILLHPFQHCRMHDCIQALQFFRT